MKKYIFRFLDIFTSQKRRLKLFLEKLLSNTDTFKSVGSRSSIFTAMAWYSAFIFLGCIGTAIIFESIRTYIIIIGSIVCLFPLVMFVVIFFKNPTLLSSEEFLIEQKKLQIIQEKGKDIIFNPMNLTTPDMKQSINEST